jgi:predicted nucleotidyltransferase
MINIDRLKPLIVEKLKPLNPDKIILFGSYAYGHPNEYSDIDLFVLKDIEKSKIRQDRLQGQKLLWDLVKQEKIGFDLFVDSSEQVNDRIKNFKDQFYQEILDKGVVIYAK